MIYPWKTKPDYRASNVLEPVKMHDADYFLLSYHFKNIQKLSSSSKQNTVT